LRVRAYIRGIGQDTGAAVPCPSAALTLVNGGRVKVRVPRLPVNAGSGDETGNIISPVLMKEKQL